MCVICKFKGREDNWEVISKIYYAGWTNVQSMEIERGVHPSCNLDVEAIGVVGDAGKWYRGKGGN